MARPPRKKKAIERAALELFAEVGIDGTSIRMIAERADVTEGALYRHHASKDDLVRALFFDYFDRFGRLLAEAQEKAASIREQLLAMIEGFYAAYDDDPKSFHFVLVVQHRLLDEIRRDLANPIEVIMNVIRQAMERGEIPRQDASLSAQLLLGMVMQAAVGKRYHRVSGPMRSHASEVTDACLRVLQWRGQNP